ncbi:hypothetical protein [Microbacterium sp. CIAB417]|uniref:hypothetical protein n=1 Tax=Microbacterium sp. CIAB417 TaxID=2860287 RepID=UPI001FADFF13|nr:hypothetical protein [Microbacterium sp. CIAB417]
MVVRTCTPLERATGTCTVRDTNTGTELVIDGSRTEEGTRGEQSDGTDSPGTAPEDDGWYTTYEYDFGTCLEHWSNYIGCFLAREEAEEPAEEDSAPALPAITISDLARFAPDGTTVVAEPENVGVAGLPTNFVAAASAQTVEGELFGYPISVRFTPAGFDFDYGDGSTTTTTDGGRSWADLDQAQFTPTPTSHAYAERGEYLASVDVRYTAEIDLGIGWLPIDGQVTSEGADQRIRIFEAHTALVAFTCEQKPSSPGC